MGGGWTQSEQNAEQSGQVHVHGSAGPASWSEVLVSPRPAKRAENTLASSEAQIDGESERGHFDKWGAPFPMVNPPHLSRIRNRRRPVSISHRHGLQTPHRRNHRPENMGACQHDEMQMFCPWIRHEAATKGALFFANEANARADI